MRSNRINFSQPFWEFLLPLLAFLGLLPLYLSEQGFVGFVLLSKTLPLSEVFVLSGFGSYIFSSICLMLLAWKTSDLVKNHFLAKKVDYITSLLVVIFGSTAASLFGVSEHLFALVVLLFALSSVLSCGREEKCQHHIFNVGLLTGLCLVLNAAFWFVPLVFVVMITFIRGFSLRDFAIFCVGLLNAWFLKITLEFLITDLWNFSYSLRNEDLVNSGLSSWQATYLVAAGVLVFAGFIMSSVFLRSSSNKMRERFQLTSLGFIIFGICGVFMFGINHLVLPVFLLVPLLSVLTFVALDSIKNRYFKALVSFCLLAIVVSWVGSFL